MKADFNTWSVSGSIEIDQKDCEMIWNLMGKIVPDFVSEAFWMIKDTFKYRRALNVVRILQKMEWKLKESWIWQDRLKRISPKLFWTIIEKWSLEEDESLQDRRANLLFCATTNTNNIQIISSYSDILWQLGAVEVKILDSLYQSAQKASMSQKISLDKVVFDTEKISLNFGQDLSESILVIENFFRLRLVEAPEFEWMTTWLWLHPILRTNMRFQFTSFGIDFICTCKFKNIKDSAI